MNIERPAQDAPEEIEAGRQSNEIAPDQAQLEFEGEAIELDPGLSPLENAQRLFREYRKARDAGRDSHSGQT